MRRRNIAVLMAALVAGCDAASDVEVLPLPAIERPSPEARLGLPEIAGSWRFAGWEVIRGDSASLERTFPSFGELRIQTQRLDSIAGVFALGGGPARVVGDVRRNGRLALVTLGPAGADRFIAGQFAQDTLWLELTSVLAADEWPQNARAAFVREPVAEPIAWLRGARPGAEPAPAPSMAPVDSMARMPPTATPRPGVLPPTQPGPGQFQPRPAPTTQPGPAPTTQPRPAGPAQPQPQPSGGQQLPAQPRPQPVSPAPSPAPRDPTPEPEPQPRQPEPEPEPRQPEPEPEPEPDLPPLLGDPVR